MKSNYVVRYVLSDLLYSGNRAFTLINLIAISIAVSVLVILVGGFLAFRQNGQQIMDSLGLSIEICPKEERALTIEEKKKLQELKGASSVHTWTPGIFLFFNSEGRLYDGLGGRTVELDDPLFKHLKDVRNQAPVRFISQNEIGIIVPFLMLKQLSYLPPSASADKPDSWGRSSFPEKMKIVVKEDRPEVPSMNIEIPVIGIVAELESGRYLIPKNTYHVLGSSWHNEYLAFLVGRDGKRLYPSAPFTQNIADPFARDVKEYADTHATLYIADREEIIPVLRKIRNELFLKADCAVEHYLEDYKQQETFFMAAAGGICVVMFFFAGVVLFSNFQALVLRKQQEIGILKACGASKFLVYSIFAMEALFISAMSILSGMAIGIVCGLQVERYIVKMLQIPSVSWFIFPPRYVLFLFGIAMFFCLFITFFPVRTAMKVDPDQVIRG